MSVPARNDGGPVSSPVYTDHNPPAFPRTYSAAGHNGMTLRDWFAGQALPQVQRAGQEHATVTRDDIAVEAYRMADALLAARAKPDGGSL